MRYFKLVPSWLAWRRSSWRLLAGKAGAQQPATPTSPGVPRDFASSANARVNYYRAMAKLPPLVSDGAISAGAYNHARYLVKNGIAGGDIVLDKRQLHV